MQLHRHFDWSCLDGGEDLDAGLVAGQHYNVGFFERSGRSECEKRGGWGG